MSRQPATLCAANTILDPSFAVEHIIPFPYSSNIELVDGEPRPFLSKLSRMAIDAAAVVWKAHPDAKIVLVGETCYEGEVPDTTDLMLERGQEQGIAPEAFVPIHALRNGNLLNNTYWQTEAVVEYAETNPEFKPSTSIELSLDYHMQRVSHTAQAWRRLRGSQFGTVESILHAAGDHSYDQYLPLIAGLHRSEKVLNVENLMDRRGRLLNFIAKHAGARIVDITEAADGSLYHENGLSLQKQRSLTATT